MERKNSVIRDDNHALDPSNDRANGHKGKLTAVEDSKLKDALQTHSDKDWFAISALVPKIQ
jgi:hypothetical protein